MSGDAGICDEVKKVSPNTIVHATMVGVGDSTVSIHPEQSTDSIRSKVKSTLLEILRSVFETSRSFQISSKIH